MNHHRWVRFLHWVVLAVIAADLLVIPSELKGAQAQEAGGVTLSAQAGFDGYCKKDEWIPIQVAVRNMGADLEARVQVSYQDKIYYGSDLLLPATSNKRLFLYVFDQGFSRDLNVSLSSGEVTLAKVSLKLTCLSNSNRLIGLLVEDPSTFTALTEIPIEGGSVRLAQLAPVDLPDQAQGWAGLDALVVSGLDMGSLTAAQQRALHNWLAGGGKLLVVGGLKWQGATSGLGGILPVEVNGTRTVANLSALQVFSEVPLPSGSTATLATGRLHEGAQVLAEQAGIPLIASREVGLGSVVLLAADPGLKPLSGWSGIQDLYDRVLDLEHPRLKWDDGYWESNSANTALSTLSELGLPSFLYICGWLMLYVAVIGPVHYLVLRRSKRRELAWLTIPALVIVFTGVAYLSGFLFRGRQPILNRLAVLQAWEGSESAQVNAMVGLYSPNRARYTLQADDPFKFHPFESDSTGVSGAWRSLQTGSGTLLTDVQVEIGGVQAVAVEGYLPALAFDHDLVLALSAKSPALTGTITNTSAVALKDAILVTPVGTRELGDLPPSASQAINEQFLAGYSGSPYYFLDYNDIRSSFYTYRNNEEARRRDALLGAFLDGEKVASWGIYLMGWIDEPLLPVALREKAYKAVDTTFYIAMLTPSITLEGDSLYLPPNMFSWETENEDYSGTPYYAGIYSFPVGGVSTYFRPAISLRYRTVKSLTLNIQASAPPDKFTVSLWDYENQEWSQIDDLKWGSLDIPRPWRYVGPQGEIGLNIDSELEDEWVEIEPSNFSLVVEP